VVLAVIALLRARSAGRRRLLISSGHAGTVTGDSAIVLDAGGTLEAPRDRRFLPERVVVLVAHGEKTGAYREGPLTATEIIEGDQQDLVAAAEHEERAGLVAALITLALGSIPLVVAAAAGMLL
jgi:hypothetical protein